MMIGMCRMKMLRCTGLVVLGLALAVVSADANEHKPAEPPLPEHAGSQHYDDDGHHNTEYDHESILGSHEKVEEYKGLKPEEAKKRLGVLVDRMDTNHDGVVTKEELQAWIQNSFNQLDQEYAKRRLKDHDEDGNGTLTWEELLKGMYGYKPAEIAEFEKTPEMASFIQMFEFHKKRFNAADQNQDNSLDVEEYSAYLNAHNHEHVAGVEVEQTLHSMDKDRDGKLSFDEYRGDEVKYAEDDHEGEAAEKADYKKFDKNNDGILDKDEVKRWIMSGYYDTAKKEAEHLIKEADKNRDGELSKDEIVDAHALFVGSRATDYGQTLEKLPRDEL